MLHKINLYKDKLVDFFKIAEADILEDTIKPLEQIEEPLFEQVRVLIMHIKKYNILDSLLQSVSKNNQYSLIDSKTLKNIIVNGLKPYMQEIEKAYDLESVSNELINLLKLSQNELNQIY